MIRVRPAQSQDVPRLMEIASHSPTAARWNQEAYAKLFAPDTSPGLAGLVIEEDGHAMGFLVGRSVDAQGDNEWEIENVAVSGPARRRGLGSRLLGEFLRLVRERGGREIFLEVRESNRAARTLYEKWAFVEAGRRKAYYQNPQEDALILKFSFVAPP
jgi:[ribosomal protein S18]-alanine N-acetyltransferase